VCGGPARRRARVARRLRGDDARGLLERHGGSKHDGVRLEGSAHVMSRMVRSDGGEEAERLRERERVLRTDRGEVHG